MKADGTPMDLKQWRKQWSHPPTPIPANATGLWYSEECVDQMLADYAKLAEERERVLVEGDDSVLSQAHIALCWVQEKMPQFYPDMIQRIKKQCGIALDEYESRAALATPTAEQPAQPSAENGVRS